MACFFLRQNEVNWLCLFDCQVYQEYIHDRHHTHMNSTQWETLTDFVKWLGKEGHCVVDETEKGWFIQYIDRDPETIRRQESLQKKEKMDLDDEERRARFIQQQIERSSKDLETEIPVYTEIQREAEDDKVEFRLPVAPATKKVTSAPICSSAFHSDAATADKARKKSKESASSSSGNKRKSALDEIMEMEEELKKKKHKSLIDSSSAKPDTWLWVGIVVKVVTPKLGEKHYRKKGVVVSLADKYSGVIQMLDSSDRIVVDDAHLETVIPALGRRVIVLHGEHRGQSAVLESINEAQFCCTVRLQSGPLKGQVLSSMQYEHISKWPQD